MCWDIDREGTATTRKQVCNKMTFKEGYIRAQVNGDRWPGIRERKLGEGNVKFLIDNEGRMIKSV